MWSVNCLHTSWAGSRQYSKSNCLLKFYHLTESCKNKMYTLEKNCVRLIIIQHLQNSTFCYYCADRFLNQNRTRTNQKIFFWTWTKPEPNFVFISEPETKPNIFFCGFRSLEKTEMFLWWTSDSPGLKI